MSDRVITSFGWFPPDVPATPERAAQKLPGRPATPPCRRPVPGEQRGRPTTDDGPPSDPVVRRKESDHQDERDCIDGPDRAEPSPRHHAEGQSGNEDEKASDHDGAPGPTTEPVDLFSGAGTFDHLEQLSVERIEHVNRLRCV
ncbi:MAG: hypothetical protein ACSLFO_02240 [Acidimicrobiales bacterium]